MNATLPPRRRPWMRGLIVPVSVVASVLMCVAPAHAKKKKAATTQSVGASEATGATTGPSGPDAAAVTVREFIFETAPFPSCHASTIVQTKGGLVAAFFGGTHERAPDVGIWVSRHTDAGWSPVVEVADGVQPNGQPRLPCWNPVLFQPKRGPLMLFYKIGPSPALWWGMLRTSEDGGVTWSDGRKLPDGMVGPAKDKPIQLSDGAILCPSGTEKGGDRLHFERTADLGQTWTATPWLNPGQPPEPKLEQPTLLDHGGGHLQYLCRSKNDFIYQGFSQDDGQTWDKPSATALPNPDSGIDAVQLKDGRSLLVYNPSKDARHPLSVAISPDGKTWHDVLVLEDSEGPQLSYPAVMQASDGLVHVTWTWERKRIRHAVIDPTLLH
jgi:predicted neuraminidase